MTEDELPHNNEIIFFEITTTTTGKQTVQKMEVWTVSS